MAGAGNVCKLVGFHMSSVAMILENLLFFWRCFKDLDGQVLLFLFARDFASTGSSFLLAGATEWTWYPLHFPGLCSLVVVSQWACGFVVASGFVVGSGFGDGFGGFIPDFVVIWYVRPAILAFSV